MSPFIINLDFDKFNIFDFLISKILYKNSLEFERDLLYKFKFLLEDCSTNFPAATVRAGESFSINESELNKIENLFFKY